MKVLFAVKSLNNAVGGAERVLCTVANGLVQRGYDVSVLTFDAEGGESFYPLNDKVSRIDIGIGQTQKSAQVIETFKRICAMRRVVKNIKPDVVIGFMHSMFVPLSLSLLGLGLPVIASEHIVPQHYKDRRFEFFLLLISSLFLDVITVVSEHVKNLYPSFLQKKMVAIPNPVGLDQEVLRHHDLKSDQYTILNVGRLDAQKDQALLINSFSRIAQKFPNWRVKIFGQGELEEQLQQQISELKLAEQVSLCGVVDDIFSEYRKADIFALSSKYESFGLATAEALSCGVAAVGFADCPGTNELIIDPENGFLIDGGFTEEERIQGFANGLSKLMSDSELRKKMSENARATMRSYSVQTVVGEWEALIKRFTKI